MYGTVFDNKVQAKILQTYIGIVIKYAYPILRVIKNPEPVKKKDYTFIHIDFFKNSAWKQTS